MYPEHFAPEFNTFPESDSSTSQRIHTLLENAGLDVHDSTLANIKNRLMLLNEQGHFISDVESCMNLIDRLGEKLILSHEETRAAKLGTILSDIGKSGPSNLSEEDSKLIVQIFAVDNASKDLTITNFLDAYLSHDANKIRPVLTGLGFNLDAPMRTFWDSHVHYTAAIIADRAAIPLRARAAAMMHHRFAYSHLGIEGQNPLNLVNEHDEYVVAPFSALGKLGKVEKLVMLTDKYDAAITRAKCPHQTAIQIIHDGLTHHPQYKTDAEFLEILRTMDATLAKIS